MSDIEPQNLKAKSDRRAISVIVNCCLIIVMVFAWIADQRPTYAWMALLGGALTTASGLSGLLWIKRGEKPNETLAEAPSDQETSETDNSFLEGEAYRALILQRIAAAKANYSDNILANKISQHAEYILRQQAANERSAHLGMLKVLRTYEVQEGTYVRTRQVQHYDIGPVASRYILNVGPVQISMDGDEATVSIKGAKVIKFDTTATALTSPDDQPSNQPLAPQAAQSRVLH